VIGDLDHTFTAVIEPAGPTSNWCVIVMPHSFEFFGTGKAVKVIVEIDGEELSSAFMSNGEGAHLMPINATVRKKIGKGVGDTVTVHLTRRLS
jgi:hypothetical protein